MRYRTTIHVFLIYLTLGLAVERLTDFLEVYLSEVHVSLPSASSDVLMVTSRLPFSGFELVGSTCGSREKKGGGWDFTNTYRSNEMKLVFISDIGYGNKRKALESIDRLVGKSSEVIEDSRLAHAASTADFRLVLRFDYPKKSAFTILKYDGGNSYETIDSTHLKTAEDFEKWRRSDKSRN